MQLFLSLFVCLPVLCPRPFPLRFSCASVAGVEFRATHHAGSTSLTVQLQHSCFPADSLDTVKVASTGKSGHNCQFVHVNGRCSQTVHTYNCSCDPNNTTYTISFTEASDGSTDEWEVIGKLAKSGQEIRQKRTLHPQGKIMVWCRFC